MSEQEPSKELPRNSNVKEQKSALFGVLGHVLVVSRNKFDRETASNSDRQKWGRLIVSACEAYARLLQTTELEALSERLDKIEGR